MGKVKNTFLLMVNAPLIEMSFKERLIDSTPLECGLHLSEGRSGGATGRA